MALTAMSYVLQRARGKLHFLPGNIVCFYCAAGGILWESLLIRKRNYKSSHIISCHLSINKSHLDIFL